MLRKLTIILLSGVICLLGVTSVLAAKYNEAPMLRTKVAAGELPPVEERLPEEPLVIKVKDEIGKYGGTLTKAIKLATNWSDWNQLEPWIALDQADANKWLPNIVTEWEMPKKGETTFTFKIRKGIKWSDGELFTAEDIWFWYEDVLLNEEITPVIPGFWLVGGELPKLEQLDEWTFRFDFGISTPGLEYLLPWGTKLDQTAQNGLYDPKHYLKQFHIKYNPNANKLAKDEGFENWTQLFLVKWNQIEQRNPDLPVLTAWVPSKIMTDHVIFERNPYYWKVDEAGNQLPYIDYLRGVFTETTEARVGKIISGEIDIARNLVDISSYPLIKQEAEKHNLEVCIVPAVGVSNQAFFWLNHTVKDGDKRKLFNNKKFKQALSLAIDRQEISEAIYLGQLAWQNVQPTVSPDSILYEKRFSEAYCQYDMDQSNRLLDEIGLDKRGSDGFRLMPNGKPFTVYLEVGQHQADHALTGELLIDYWKKVGVNSKLKVHSHSLYFKRARGNEIDAGIWVFNSTQDRNIMAGTWWLEMYLFQHSWRAWWITDGKEGIEPSEEAKKFFSNWEALRIEWDRQERIRLGKESLELLSENLWAIGIVGPAVWPAIKRKNLKNVWLEPVLASNFLSRGWQWYFE